MTTKADLPRSRNGVTKSFETMAALGFVYYWRKHAACFGLCWFQLSADTAACSEQICRLRMRLPTRTTGEGLPKWTFKRRCSSLSKKIKKIKYTFFKQRHRPQSFKSPPSSPTSRKSLSSSGIVFPKIRFRCQRKSGDIANHLRPRLELGRISFPIGTCSSHVCQECKAHSSVDVEYKNRNRGRIKKSPH